MRLIALACIAAAMVGCGQKQQAAASQDPSELEAVTDSRVEIYNGSTVLTIPNPLNRGIKVLVNGGSTLASALAPALITQDARDAADSIAFTRDFYATAFGRASYDGLGSRIRAVVEVQRYHLVPVLGLKQNAAWMSPFGHFVFGAGGDGLDGFPGALDVVAHEFTHAVISSSSNLEYVGQSGALNEHLADVFGEIIQHARDPESRPFLIGETVLRGEFAERAEALRDMLNPERGLSKQPASMTEVDGESAEFAEFAVGCVAASDNDNCGVHILSGIPNRAAALIIQEIGWERAANLFYTVMTERLTTTSNFADYRDAILAECAATLTASDCAAATEAFQVVGL